MVPTRVDPSCGAVAGIHDPGVSSKPVERSFQLAEPPQVGVEEEFFLIDLETGRAAPRAAAVLTEVESRFAGLVQKEFSTSQVEVASSPHVDLRSLCRELEELRGGLSDVARSMGCELVASGSALLEQPAGEGVLTDDPRYRRIAHEYGAVARGENCCGCHVHVEVPDREEAVQVCNHLRPWLPVLQALTANSPFTGGTDSGYGSWRAMAFSRWPSAGMPPFFESAADYAAVVDSLLHSGVILDQGMIYWLVRPSHHLPTVEIRAADVCATVGEAVLLAAVVRGLVMTALRDIRAGVPAPRPADTLLHAAYWRAARDGLEGKGVEPVSGALLPAWDLVDRLVDRIRPALAEAGDLETVLDRLAWLRRVGSGAARQRAAYARRHSLRDVGLALSLQTAPHPV
ncbi:carboxylate-amine ligase [Streptosporangium becharense]|uniref:Putative glutamate--cysteine ligase 2 n=1 Tax=Streptosporangium becharense TaxID=1816182 RepID=A0A7W9IHH5_9ACTN|nr:glutamate--cysteine ligase [Streptosporangium becharense]MBB2912489.1 carboxylate-amine ligase [Streptosporangium becharense]MBB5820681.1 carboxylate-amine ligase [Streptosporangium becharense]